MMLFSFVTILFFNSCINSKQAIKQEWDRIITMAQNNGFPIHLIHELKNKIVTKENNIITIPREQNNSKKWITFTFYSPAINKVANYSEELT